MKNKFLNPRRAISDFVWFLKFEKEPFAALKKSRTEIGSPANDTATVRV